jgi:hypothetical protein
MTRHCSGCTLCCKLLPMQSGTFHPAKHPEAYRVFGTPGMLHDFDKAAGARCPHQRHTGCAVYAKRPMGCRCWSCRWLTEQDTADLRRPDRTGYVIDAMPDFIRAMPHDGSESRAIQVVQIWIDPKRRDAWVDDEALWRYLERRAAEGMAAILRFNTTESLVLIPPQISGEPKWGFVTGPANAPERSLWPEDVEVKVEVKA